MKKGMAGRTRRWFQGSFKFTGTTAPDSNVVNGHSAGTVTY
jgi:hypothetical protein